jgi:hypothetical protein
VAVAHFLTGTIALVDRLGRTARTFALKDVRRWISDDGRNQQPVWYADTEIPSAAEGGGFGGAIMEL